MLDTHMVTATACPAQLDLQRVLRVWADERQSFEGHPAVELVQMLALADFQAGIDTNTSQVCVAIWGERLNHIKNLEAAARKALCLVDDVIVSSDTHPAPWLRIALT